MATNSGGWLYEPTGTPVDKATADNAQARVLEIKQAATTASTDAAKAVQTANSYAGQIAQANTTAGSALTTAQGAEDAVERLDTDVTLLKERDQLAPGQVVDQETALVLNDPNSESNTALKAQSVAATQSLYVPAELAMMVVDATEDPGIPRGDAPGMRIFLFDDTIPTEYVEGVDLLARPKDYLAGLPTAGLRAAWSAEALTARPGTVLEWWPSVVGDFPMQANGGPIVYGDGADRYIETDGVDDHLFQRNGPGITAQPVTMAIVARYLDPQPGQVMVGNYAASSGFNLGIAPSGSRFAYAGSSVSGSMEDDQWHVYWITQNSPNSELMVDGVVDAAGDFGTRPKPDINLFYSSAGFVPGQVKAVLAWDSTFSAADRVKWSKVLMAKYRIGG